MRTIRKTLKNNPATKHFLVFILRIIQSFIAAGSAVFVVYTFNRLVLTMQRFELRLLPGQPVWTISGAFLVVMVIYKISPLSKIEGAQCYIDTVNKEKGHFIFKDTVFKYWASLFTLGTFGNGGILAPMGRVTAGLNCAVERKLHKIQKFDLKIGAISGFAATIGVIFHAPIAGGFFAVEILSKANMRYRYLFPALFSSALAVYFAKLLHLHPFYRFHIPTKEIPMGYYFYVLLIGMITGIVGRLYNEFYKLIVSISKRNEKKHLLLEVLIGATSVSLLAFFINPDLMGTSNNLIDQLTHDVENLRGNLPGSMNMIIVLVILLIVKMVGNCVTVGSGMSAGFTGPIIIVGMIIGVIFSTIARIEYYSVGFYALICAGFTGMLASSMNIPVAAMILAVELFGYNFAIVGIIATITAFKINEYSTLFDY